MKVAILGYGVEGKASYKYWSDLGDDVTIVDENENIEQVPANAKILLGKDALTHLQNFDLIIKTPPLRPDRVQTNGKVWSATNEFFARCPLPIIGVTGTKGKGTTATLISKILEAAGYKTWLVGNIGVPALDLLPQILQYAKSNTQKGADFSSPQSSVLSPDNGIVVFELSSFQLWDLQKSPGTAVVLMIEPDHMDVHSSMEEYVAAKANITRHQSAADLLVYHPTNEFSAQIAAASPAGTKKRYMSPEGAVVDSEVIEIDGQAICHVSEVGLLGAHNLENVCAAITAAWHYTQDVDTIKQAVTSFKGLPHRLEFVREVKGIKFYDDSQATGVGSTVAALRSFTQPTVVILGGSDKGVDISRVIDELDPQRNFVVLVGQSSQKLEKLLHARHFDAFVNLGQSKSMTEIVNLSVQHAHEGDVVLLSPAHASFDMFKSYQDRGDQFKQAVNSL